MEGTMTGAQKAAVLMVLLGEETSASILRHFDEPEILAIGRAVASLGEIPPETAEIVLREYRDRIVSHRGVGEGGPAVARRILERTLPPDRTPALETGPAGREVPASWSAEPPPEPGALFAALASVKDQDLGQALELEHPQTAALVLLHLTPQRAASVLASMGEDAQAGITSRLTRLQKVATDVTREVSDALAARFEATRSDGIEERDGTGAAAEILKRLDRGRSRAILSRLETIDQESAETLRSRVYTFELLMLLQDRGVQELLKGVDAKQLALALKGAPPEMGEKFFRNMSSRAADLVKDEMEILGVPRIKDVEAAQKEMLDKALKLEESGTITFATEEGGSV